METMWGKTSLVVLVLNNWSPQCESKEHGLKMFQFENLKLLHQKYLKCNKLEIIMRYLSRVFVFISAKIFTIFLYIFFSFLASLRGEWLPWLATQSATQLQPPLPCDHSYNIPNIQFKSIIQEQSYQFVVCSCHNWMGTQVQKQSVLS